jgi:hypothetical protein
MIINNYDVNGAPPAADSAGGQEAAGDDGSESAARAISQASPLVRSIFGFGVHQGVHAPRNGLCLPEHMSFDSWRELGTQVYRVMDCSVWWLGDWLVYGEKTYGDRYKQAITDASLSYQTLRNYAWVARRFPLSRRRDTLSFAHHAEVAALADDEQDVWLGRAEQSNWPCSQLRRRLRAAQLTNRQTPADEKTVHTRALKIDVPTERHDRWESAAIRQHCSVADWIIVTLDHAASEELE